MNRLSCAGMVLAGLLPLSLPGFAQQQLVSSPSVTQQPTSSPDSAKDQFVLDVVVTDKSGTAIKGLEEKNFAVRDKGQPAKVVSFHAVDTLSTAASADNLPVKIILFIDELNTSYNRLASERIELERFLQQNGGKLPHPVALYFFSQTGLEKQNDFTTDGNALKSLLDKHVMELRTDQRSQGFYGDQQRFQRSLNALNAIAGSEVNEPGRKIMIWVSPGWPILAGANVTISANDQKALLTSIIAVSTALREARMTVDMIDPLGARDQKDVQQQGVNYYEEFLKPVTDAKSVEAGHLALQVVAVHSGGLVLNVNNDIVGELNRCIADASAYYTLTLDKSSTDKPDVYHAIDVKVDTPKVTARTLRGYYTRP
jgi:VWFA-related protein